MEGVVHKSVEAMMVALHESEAKVQNTLHVAQERIDARFQNQQRHHDEDMHALYDQIVAFQQEGDQSSQGPHRSPSP